MGNTGEIVRRPAVPRPIRVRRNVLSLPPNDPILDFYGQAIDQMKAKPLSDPTSWRYQAAIHDYVRAEDPLQQPSDLPLPPDAATFWRACEHRAWFFLPWHRMYLHHFEMMVLNEVIRLGGPTDWALPYWNYSAADPNSRLLPEAFRSGRLFVRQREVRANAGQQFMTGLTVSLACLRETVFRGAPGGSEGFGGLPPVLPATKNHANGPFAGGAVELAPHNGVHGALSGDDFPGGVRKPLQDRGWMGDFTRAPLDPIFWVHHCNIDRLWEIWTRTLGRLNPTTADWRNTSFPFRDVNRARVDMTPAQVVDTRADPLFYIYDDISAPVP